MDSILKVMDLGAKGLWLPITLIMPKKEISWREIYVTIGVIGLSTWVADNIFAGYLNLVDFGYPNYSEMVSY